MSTVMQAEEQCPPSATCKWHVLTNTALLDHQVLFEVRAQSGKPLLTGMVMICMFYYFFVVLLLAPPLANETRHHM